MDEAELIAHEDLLRELSGVAMWFTTRFHR